MTWTISNSNYDTDLSCTANGEPIFCHPQCDRGRFPGAKIVSIRDAKAPKIRPGFEKVGAVMTLKMEVSSNYSSQ